MAFFGNQIVLVEFDSYANPEWDPRYEHVGINNNSIASAVSTSWNATSFHSGDIAMYGLPTMLKIGKQVKNKNVFVDSNFSSY
ncbi:hypothetical protein Pyn_05596 [Prunus yedoensis var. nudiflora]|uniref:Legume lectin domain-containing protein n=1 Tax=Prunus yedoensis var. nudiflora TaxID=2094558 RepID=A0A314Y7B1_PRUYE|nr:hypothetical protein Pyn_05596 [Prunus yedoensis var. nudiflora]